MIDIFIGQEKPISNYILATTMQLHDSGFVMIRARGRSILRAIDVAEILKRKTGITIKNVETESLQHKNKEGRDINVSAIRIELRYEK